MIVGVGLFALPAGIIGASLALKVEEDTCTHSSLRQRHAAALLQNAWKVHRIESALMTRRPSHPRILVRLSSYNQSMQFDGQPNTPNTQERHYLDALAVQFIFLLKFHLNKSRFRLTVEISDSNNFYETYMQTSWQQTNLILSLQNSLEHLRDMANTTSETIRTIFDSLQTNKSPRNALPSNENIGNDDDDDDDNNNDGGGAGGARGDKDGSKPMRRLRLKKRRVPLSRVRGLFCCWSCLYKRRENKKTNLPTSPINLTEIASGSIDDERLVVLDDTQL